MRAGGRECVLMRACSLLTLEGVAGDEANGDYERLRALERLSHRANVVLAQHSVRSKTGSSEGGA